MTTNHITSAQRTLETAWSELQTLSNALPESQRNLLAPSFRLLVDLDREMEWARVELTAVNGGAK
jgi:hypothetical protein